MHVTSRAERLSDSIGCQMTKGGRSEGFFLVFQGLGCRSSNNKDLRFQDCDKLPVIRAHGYKAQDADAHTHIAWIWNCQEARIKSNYFFKDGYHPWSFYFALHLSDRFNFYIQY